MSKTPATSDSPTAVLFALTVFLSAGLLFVVEPMVGKMLLPLLGGTPAVWNSCMLFFQTVLLGGYAYAHLLSGRLSLGRQVMVHLALCLVAAVVLPIAVSPSAEARLADGAAPVPWLLFTLSATVGLPFFVLSACAPLLQSWFARRGGTQPYALYAASNAGSMLALLAYPFILEPRWALRTQARGFTFGFAALVILLAAAAALTVSRQRPAPPSGARVQPGSPASGNVEGEISMSRRLRWLYLACVPSSLMLGVTTYITTDVVAIPLLWVLPLALYLLTFILVFLPFDRFVARLRTVAGVILGPVVGLQVFLLLGEVKIGHALTIAVHLVGLFLLALACHAALAADRPAAKDLTGFYLVMSAGGVVGGMFNALLAPLLFKTVLEYPVAIVAGLVALRPKKKREPPPPLVDPDGEPSLAAIAAELTFERRRRLRMWMDFIAPAIIALLALLLIWELKRGGWGIMRLADKLGMRTDSVRTSIAIGIPLALSCAVFLLRPFRFGIAVALLLMAHGLVLDRTHVVHRDRSFFGVLAVTKSSSGRYHWLVHGNILHGEQRRDTPDWRSQPLTYYHRKGPVGQVFEAMGEKGEHADRHHRLERVALVGLGSGTMAAYGRPDRRLTFYEIDAKMVKIARNPDFFSYLSDCEKRGGHYDVVLGDARLQLARSDDRYDVIVLDAFTSDAIPLHLLTAEAMKIYVEHLREAGLLLVHISNRYVDLKPVLGNLAAELGLIALVEHDEEDDKIEKGGSSWVLLARRKQDIVPLDRDRRWEKLPARPWFGVWRDDFSNVLRVFRW